MMVVIMMTMVKVIVTMVMVMTMVMVIVSTCPGWPARLVRSLGANNASNQGDRTSVA